MRTANRAGATTSVTPGRSTLPAPLPWQGSCWYPPHLDSKGTRCAGTGRSAGSPRCSAPAARGAVDIYDIDGFLTTKAEVTAIKTTWQAATLPHPKAVCYLDLAWEDYRPDGTPGRAFPAAALGNIYFGYPAERWVDFRQLDALKPMLDERIGMCARKGFDAVELDDIDSFDPPSTTGFHLTPGDVQNYLAYAFNLIHADGMTGLWKNSPLLSSWGRQYTDGAVVEECYVEPAVLRQPVRRQPPVRDHLHRLSGPTPCGWDDFTDETGRVGRARPSTPTTATSAIRVRCAKGRTRSVPTAERCTRSRTVSRPSSSTSTWTASSSIPAHDN